MPFDAAYPGRRHDRDSRRRSSPWTRSSRKLDFLSIGTNDLIQYTLAVDRADEAVAHLYNPLHPAVVRLLAQAIGTANKAQRPIAVCGEMAGEVDLTRLLLGLGLRNFSMHPAQLLAVKQRVLTSEACRHQAVRRPHPPRRQPRPDRRAGRQAQRALGSVRWPARAGMPRLRGICCCLRCRRVDPPCRRPFVHNANVMKPTHLHRCARGRSRRRLPVLAVEAGDAAPAFSLPHGQGRRRRARQACAARSSTSTSGRRGAGPAAARFPG